MPSTTTTKEQFPKGTPEGNAKAERELKIQAGAVTSELTGSEEDGWTLTTVWNIIGQ